MIRSSRFAHAEITGHTYGLGKELSLRFKTFTGYSRGNGFPISEHQNIIDAIPTTSRLFINNAHDGFHQVDLLYKMYDLWKHDAKACIVNIGSNAPDGIVYAVQKYAVEKAALEHACDQLSVIPGPRVILVKPGFIDTPRVGWFLGKKLPVSDVADVIIHMIDYQHHIPKVTIVPPCS